MDTSSATSLPEDRLLTEQEHGLIRWLLEHGGQEASTFLPQLESARVVSRCSCGCASIDFSVAGRTGSPQAGLHVLSDYQWNNAEGHLLGVFVFAREELLAGLECWSIDGQSTASALPLPEQLRSINVL
jgi:hypothetical protein